MADKIWKESKDPKSGRSYYYNRKTRETTWKRPASMVPKDGGNGERKTGMADGGDGEPPVAAPPRRAQKKSKAKKTVKADTGLPPNWRSRLDEKSGRMYYYNKTTKQTTWRRPEDESEDSIIDSVTRSSSSSSRPKNERKKPLTTKLSLPATWSAGNEGGAARNNAEEVNMPMMSSRADAPVAPARKERRQKTGNVSADGNWEEVVDPKTKTNYWYNKKTKATSWVLPSAAALPPVDPSKPALSDLETALSTSPALTGVANNKAMPPGTQLTLDNDAAGTKTTNTTTTATTSSSQSAANVAAIRKALSAAGGSGGGAKGTLSRPSENLFQLKQSLHSQSVKSLAVADARQEMKAAKSLANLGLQRGMTKLMAAEDEYMLGNDDIGSREIDYTFATHRKTVVGRLLKVGPVVATDELLSWQGDLIKKSLLKKNRDHDLTCIACFKYVMSYMGDRVSVKTNNLEHSYRLIETGLMNSADIRDEIYLQLMKQITNNPTSENVVKGWELMALCIASFPPSRKLKGHMKSFIQEALEKRDMMPRQRELVEANLANMLMISRVGQRKRVPGENEMRTVRSNEKVKVTIMYVDNTKDELEITSFTTVEDIIAQLASKLDLTLITPFGLYECDTDHPDQQRCLDKSERVCDVLAAWNPFVGSKKGSIRNLRLSPYNSFLFKARLVFKTTDPALLADPTAVNLMHLQAVQDVVQQKFPVKEGDIVVLAALQLQASLGDYDEAATTQHLNDKMHVYVPKAMYTDLGDHADEFKKGELRQQIIDNYSSIAGFSEFEAKLNYLDYVQDWAWYGVTLFEVEQRQFKDYPDILLCGVTCEGVILVHPQKQTLLEVYPYHDVVTWGHTEDRLIVVVGNLVQQRKLIFKTTEGANIASLIKSYIDFKVQGDQQPDDQQNQQ